MGLMDNIKNAQEMAKQAQEMAAQQGGGMPAGAQMPDAGDMAYAQLAQNLAANGVPCVAAIESVSETGKTDAASKQYAIQCNVSKEGEADWKATVQQFLTDDAISHYQPGARFEAKHDPADPSKLLLYGLAN
jgi:hypothetical protein